MVKKSKQMDLFKSLGQSMPYLFSFIMHKGMTTYVISIIRLLVSHMQNCSEGKVLIASRCLLVYINMSQTGFPEILQLEISSDSGTICCVGNIVFDWFYCGMHWKK